MNPTAPTDLSQIVAGRVTYTYTKWKTADKFRAKKQVATALYFAGHAGESQVAVEADGITQQPGGGTFQQLGSQCVTSLDPADPANVPDLVSVARPSQGSSAFACVGVLPASGAPTVTVFDSSRVLTADAGTPMAGYQQLQKPRIFLENTPYYLDDARPALFPMPTVSNPPSQAFKDWEARYPKAQVQDKVSVSMLLQATPTSGGAPATVLASRTYRLEASCGDPSVPSQLPNGLPRQAYPLSAWSTPAAAKSATSGPAIFAQLPHTANTVTIKVDDPNNPVRVVGDPVPISILAAPPTVAGAGQGGSEPTLTRNKGQSTSAGTSQSSHVGASAGFEWESPGGGMFGVEASASIEREVESTSTTSNTVTFSDSYSGSMDDDTVVFQTSPQFVFAGTVLTSASGIGVGTAAAISIPDSDAVTIASATVASLRARFPDLFGPGGTYTAGLQGILQHTVGDPGSYMHDTDANLDKYCIGSVDGSTAGDVSAGPALDVNPFFNNPTPPTKPDILVSNTHIVQAGTETVDGAGFDIEKGQEKSRVANTTVDVSVSVKAAYVKVGVNGGYGWGDSYSNSLTQGVGFSAGVGNIPNPALSDETYDWRMFLCNANLTTNTGRTFPVRVLNYTVDHYQGSGGLEQLGPVTAISPTGSEFTYLTPTLTWEQDSGTVKSYDWQVEAIGAQDARSGAVTFANTVDSTNNRTDQTSAEITNKLLPNQLYRWRVTGTDFFGNTAASSWEYFVTEGPPKADFTFSPSQPSIDSGVAFTDTSKSGGLLTTQSWTFPDGTVLTGPSVTKEFSKSGAYAVTLRVSNSAGKDQVTKIVPVIVGSMDDHYQAVEDTELDVDAGDGVLSNDEAPGLLTARHDAGDQSPASGALVLDAAGSFKYMPDKNFCGTDGFSYTVIDGNGFEYHAAVAIDVACVNDPPVAADATLDVTEDAPQHVKVPGLLALVTDPDIGDALTAAAVSPPEHGSVDVACDGSYTYTPDENYCGPDSFTYQVSDGQATSNVATITIDVGCVNDVPLAIDDSYRTPPGQALTIDAARGVLANDPDVEDGLASIATLEDSVIHGDLDLRSDGSFTYTPDAGFSGADTFTYFPGDGTDQSPVPATVTITVAGRNTPPPSGGGSAGPGGGSDGTSTGGPAGIEVLGVSQVLRIAGPNRFDTSALVAQEFGNAPAVILANGEAAKQGADALSANYLAGLLHAPILLTQTTKVSDMTLSTIGRVLGGAADPTIYVMGAQDSVSNAVANAVKTAAAKVSSGSVTVVRIGGADRYATSALIAAERGKVANSITFAASSKGRTTAILASGRETADALVAGPLSYAWGIPVLLTAGDNLSPSVVKAIAKEGITQLLVLGSTGRVSARAVGQARSAGVSSMKRIVGADRFGTAAQLYEFAFATMTNSSGAHYGAGGGTAYLANGLTGFPDALSAGPLAGSHESPLLTVPPAVLPHSTGAFLAAHKGQIDAVVGLGGRTTIEQSVIDQAQAKV